ncbi:MAG: 7-cyano-7-deazaguanine synthase QueC [Vampirovibrio sp.]|nr:7-cyano-7-deazaguanine synthase QueC [Vampirovibrio sp.]
METAIALVSGGLDSVVALAKGLEIYDVKLMLTFHYGQRAWPQELKASQAVASHYAISQRVIHLPWLAELLPKALKPKQSAFPQSELLEDSSLLGLPSSHNIDPAYTETAKVWVPNRNGVFLNIGAAIAEAYSAKIILFGANVDEAQGFPDNTQEYRDYVNQSLSYSTLVNVQVETPVGELTKAEIIQEGVRLGVPLEKIWSCYEGSEIQCGVCPSCKLLKTALASCDKPVSIAFGND